MTNALAELTRAVEHAHALGEALDATLVALRTARAKDGSWATQAELERRATDLRHDLHLLGRQLEALKRDAAGVR